MKSLASKSRSPEKRKLTSFCPSGHSIPHKTPKGECTALYCAQMENEEVTPRIKLKQRKKDQANAKTSRQISQENQIEKATKKLGLQVAAQPLQLPDGASRELANMGRLEELAGGSANLGRHKARLSFIEGGLPAADADEVAINTWSDKKINALLPLAIAEKELALKFGDAGARERAADKILAANGRAQKEGTGGTGASIVLHVSGMGLQLPYMSKRLVEGQAVEVKPEDPSAKK